MSMPLRFPVSENPVTSLPAVGQVQSSLLSSSSSAVAGAAGFESSLLSARATTCGGGAGGAAGEGADAAGIATSGDDELGAAADDAFDATAVEPWKRCCISRNARSEYGSLAAFGCVL